MMRLLKETINLLGILALIVLNSCQKRDLEFLYSVFYSNEQTPSYQLRIVSRIEDQTRIDITYLFAKDGESEEINKEAFRYINGGLEKGLTIDGELSFSLYLTILTKDCVVFTFDDVFIDNTQSTRICYLGKEELLINDVKYHNALKFRKTQGGIESYIFYDNDFHMLKEEIISGNSPDYVIVRSVTPSGRSLEKARSVSRWLP
jgi:hypothetical protein